MRPLRMQVAAPVLARAALAAAALLMGAARCQAEEGALEANWGWSSPRRVLKGQGGNPHLRNDPKSIGPWAVATGMSQKDVDPALWALATPSLRLWLRCPHSRIFNRQRFKHGMAQEGLAWAPRHDRYLLLHCHYGMLSHRMFCLRHHILLAGLLNRTLLVGPFSGSPLLNGSYSWDLVFSSERVRDCFGPRSVEALAEYQASRKQAGPLQVDRVLLWSKDGRALDKNGAPADSLVLPEPEYASLGPDSPLADWLAQYGQVKEQVLMVGDLYLAFWRLPDAPKLLDIGDAPFARSSKCASPYFLQPDARLDSLITRFKRRFLRAPSYVAVHWQRQPSPDFNCEQEAHGRDWRASCGMSVDEIAGSIWRALAAEQAATFVYLVTDANSSDITALKLQLYMVENKVVRLRTSAGFEDRIASVFPEHPGQGQDLLDLVLCAQAARFLGTHRAAFSVAVQRMRYALGTATCRDTALGDGYLSPEDIPEGSVEWDFLDVDRFKGAQAA